MTKKLWPLEADPDDPNVPHATVKCANCPTHIFVAKDHPLLPDGPFFCPDHSDTTTFAKVGDHTEADLICDRCGAKLTAQATTREEAISKLWEMVASARWTSTFDGADADLCTSCKPS
jgi:hypothetical protein